MALAVQGHPLAKLRCHDLRQQSRTGSCNYPEYVNPIYEYPHNPECSITGGYVYRGINVPELEGKYIYGDYCSRKIWALSYDGINPPTNELLVTAAGPITSFGVDLENEIYVTSSNGNIYKFNPGSGCQDINTVAGWNLLSVPYLANDMSSSNIFPNPVSEVFGYNNGYYAVDTLLNGMGYWVKYNSIQSFQICGNRINFPIDVNAGWNLIAPFDEMVPVQNISSNPPNIIVSSFYEYVTGYQVADTLKPGKGYWVKTNANGTIQFE